VVVGVVEVEQGVVVLEHEYVGLVEIVQIFFFTGFCL